MADTKANATSKILSQKRVEDIIAPKPIYVTIGGTEYRVLPMPDSSLMHIGDSIREIVAILQSVASLDEIETLTADELLPLLPQVLQILLPHANALIAASIQVEESFIQENLTLAGKLQMLKLILEVEDIPLLISAFTTLATDFRAILPPTPAKRENLETPTVTGD